MAVLSVREIWNGRRGSADEKAVREYARVFRVVTSNSLDGALVAETAVDPFNGTAIPNLFASYIEPNGTTFDLTAIARKIDVVQDDSDPNTWLVTVSYSNRTDLPELGNPNPLLRPSEIKWSFAQFQRIADVDIYGAAVVNSAGEAFDPPAEKDDSRPVLVVTRNEAGFDPGIAYLYRDAVNSDAFFGAPPGTAKIQAIEATRHYENNFFYWQVTYTIHFRPDGWNLNLLDQGFNYLDTDGKTKLLIRDKNGAAVSKAVPLNGVGASLTNAFSSLTRPLEPTDTTFSVPSSAPFPFSQPLPANGVTLYQHSVQQFIVKIDQELILVPAVQNQNLTWTGVTRGYGNTVAAAHVLNANVTLQPVFLSFQVYPLLPFAPLRLP